MRAISVIFPAFNEEDNIKCTVERMIQVLPHVARQWEIIAVDDGSSDATALICDQLKRQHPQIEVIRHLQNRGCCAVLKSGIMSAKYDLIFFSDELCPLWRKLRHVALNQTGLYSATDKAQTDPILTDDATKGSSQGAFLG